MLAAALAGGAAAARSSEPADPFPTLAASYLVQVQGKTLWSHRADAALLPASLTKIMTALLVLESGRPLDEVVTVSAAAAKETGTRLGLRAGEKMRAGDLLAAALLASANDACLALAEHVGGGKAAFVERMNARARALGMTRTHFTNACGHDEPKHRASARDLAVLAGAALRQPFLAEIVALVRFRVATLGGRAFDLENKNELIGRYDGAVGVKSGWTPGAGKCVVALARRNGVTVLLVLLGAPNRWWDAVAVLDRAFAEAR